MLHMLNRLRPAPQLPLGRMTKERTRRGLVAAAGGVVLLVMSVSALLGHGRRYEHPLAPEINASVRVPVDAVTVARAAAVARASLEEGRLEEESSIAQSAREIEQTAASGQKRDELKEHSERIADRPHYVTSIHAELSSAQNEENLLHDEGENKVSERDESIWHRHDDGTASYVGSSIHSVKSASRVESSTRDVENATGIEEDADSISQTDRTSSTESENLASPLAESASVEPKNVYTDNSSTRSYTYGGSSPSAGGPSNSNGDYFSGARGARNGGGGGVEAIDSEGASVERLTTRDFGIAFGIAVAHSAVVPAGDREHLSRHDVTNDKAYRRLVRTGQLGELMARYADALENAAAGGDESLVYVRHHKLYAARTLPASTVLGEYGGRYMRSAQVSTGEYWWDLPEMLVNGKPEAWGIDATEWGNALRFCNDLGPGSWNVVMRYVPWNGHWHVVYETLTPVLENEELSVSFGSSYWATRRNGSP